MNTNALFMCVLMIAFCAIVGYMLGSLLLGLLAGIGVVFIGQLPIR